MGVLPVRNSSISSSESGSEGPDAFRGRSDGTGARFLGKGTIGLSFGRGILDVEENAAGRGSSMTSANCEIKDKSSTATSEGPPISDAAYEGAFIARLLSLELGARGESLLVYAESPCDHLSSARASVHETPLGDTETRGPSMSLA